MNHLPPITLPAAALARVDALLRQGRRCLLGLAGPPGAGKSTLASALQAQLGAQAVTVPMDGFHLAQCELLRLGRAARKGAPDTFDADGFVALLRRLRQPRTGEVVYAPAFRREIEEPVAGAIAIAPTVPLVIVEGNYLLLDEGPWTEVADLLDDAWYVDSDDVLRQRRLRARHVAFGRSAQEAADWVAITDEPNARRVAACRARSRYDFRWVG